MSSGNRIALRTFDKPRHWLDQPIKTLPTAGMGWHSEPERAQDKKNTSPPRSRASWTQPHRIPGSISIIRVGTMKFILPHYNIDHILLKGGRLKWQKHSTQQLCFPVMMHGGSASTTGIHGSMRPLKVVKMHGGHVRSHEH